MTANKWFRLAFDPMRLNHGGGPPTDRSEMEILLASRPKSPRIACSKSQSPHVSNATILTEHLSVHRTGS